MSALLSYNLLLLPGVAFFAVCLAISPLKTVALRTGLYIGLFVLIRDAMTPERLWAFDGIRITFVDDAAVLTLLGLGSVVGVALLCILERDLRQYLIWWKGGGVQGTMLGFSGGLLLALPALLLSGFEPIFVSFRAEFVAGLILMTYAGNLLEEVIFRGFLQGQLETVVTQLRAALLSGLIFAACHSYLAITVTDMGWPILIFTGAEGIVCGLLRMRYGILPAAAAHGTAIFLVSMPLG